MHTPHIYVFLKRNNLCRFRSTDILFKQKKKRSTDLLIVYTSIMQTYGPLRFSMN